MRSYDNHYLEVDLGAGTWSTFALPNEVLERYMGGKGVGAYLLAAGTGQRLALDELYGLGERIWNLTRLFNLRAGMTKEAEDLPRRFKEEPLPDGPAAGHRLTDGGHRATALRLFHRVRLG